SIAINCLGLTCFLHCLSQIAFEKTTNQTKQYSGGSNKKLSQHYRIAHTLSPD
ncbi:hypothetical protein M5D96_008140, partial [Drosophila gunungcola]